MRPERWLAIFEILPMTISEIIDSGLHPLINGIPPSWATGWGEDEFGVYAEFSIGDVVQRLRWIPPGRFWMGSPEEEEGRFNDEDPRHEVTLETGFWMMDTPVRQALWDEIYGENPSQFQGANLPVESVSYELVEEFLSALNKRIPGLDLSLPTEAQWEYACRAGSEAATYVRLDEGLQEIAWYDENSEDQTQPVGLKRANDFGLCDMLGNVWEICADHWHENYEGAPNDDSTWLSDDASANRVMRGGSWNDPARSVRAACRDHLLPASRSGNVGFRCVRVQAQAERSGGATSVRSRSATA